GARPRDLRPQDAISPDFLKSTTAFAGKIAPAISARSSERLGVISQYLGMMVTRLRFSTTTWSKSSRCRRKQNAWNGSELRRCLMRIFPNVSNFDQWLALALRKALL